MKMQKTISPIDNSIYATRPFSTSQEIQEVLIQSEKAQNSWQQTTLQSRGEYCHLFVDKILADEAKITKDLSWQMGRPISQAPLELKGLEERARYMIQIAPSSLQDILIPPKPHFTRFIKRVPLGVVLVIAAWNFPYLIAVNSIISAIMAGNTVILKHSAQTQLCAESFKSAFEKAGLPKGVFQTLNLDHDQVNQVLKNPILKHVVFTGSVAGGHAIEKSLSSSFKSSALELGGNDPAYVASDADLEYSVENLVDGSYFNSGQSCCGIERIYVHKNLYKKFLDIFVDKVNQYKLGNPLDPKTNLGPMVRTSAAETIRLKIQKAIKQGAQSLINPKNFPENKLNSPYLAPQVLIGVNHEMEIMQEEIFGPVVGIMSVKNDEEAIEFMNDSIYGLSASIWTKDEEKAIQMGNRIHTGTWFMNRCDYLDPSLAWVGVKNSGRGATLSQTGYENLTRPQSFHLKKIT